MRTLFTTQPGLGHLHPMVGVARALVESGHEVVFACAESFRPWVRGAGFDSFAAGLDWLESEAARTLPAPVNWSDLETSPFGFMTEVFVDVAARRMVPDLLSVCRSWRPDVIVRNDFEFASLIVADIVGVPCATVGIDFFMPPHVWRSLVGPQLSHLRASFGLPPHPAPNALYRHLYLSFMPPSYRFPELALPRGTLSLRPPLFDQSGCESLPDWVEDLPDRPTVYFTLGTIFNRSQAELHCVVDALSGEDLNLIVTVGRNQDPGLLGPERLNVRVERYVPQSLLLPRCDLVITHGGFNTVMGALMHGLPVLVVPIAAHHPFHALRCSTLGVGRTLRPCGRFADYFPEVPPELTPEAVRATTREILTEPTYRRRAGELRDELMALPGPEAAVEMIVGLADKRWVRAAPSLEEELR